MHRQDIVLGCKAWVGIGVQILCLLPQLADVKSLPGVRELVRLPPRDGEHHLALAHWILSSKSFAVKTLQKDEVCCQIHTRTNQNVFGPSADGRFLSFQFTNLFKLAENEEISAPVPDFLFELEYSDQMNARFQKTRAGREVFYAFHGSRLENFHSIIHNGLHCHLNKVNAGNSVLVLCGTPWSHPHRLVSGLIFPPPVQNSVFGEGTYLTSDLSMALLYSPHSSGWQESLLGPLLSCVALCEVIDHPDVKCQVKKKGAAASLAHVWNRHAGRLTFAARFRFGAHRPSALESEEQRRRRSSTQVFCSHQQSAFESEVSARVLSEETPDQVKKSAF